MSKEYKAKNSIISFVALAFLMYFIVFPIVMLMISDIFGSMNDLITNLIDLMPFGGFWYLIAVKIVSGVLSPIHTINNLGQAVSFYYILSELMKAMISSIIFEAMKLLTDITMGLKGSKGIWNKAKLWLMYLVNGLVSAYLAPFLITYILSQLGGYNSLAARLFTIVPVGIIVIGGILFFKVTSTAASYTIGKSIVYVCAKFFCLNMMQLFATYILAFVVLIAADMGAFQLVSVGMVALFLIAILLCSIDAMLDSGLH